MLTRNQIKYVKSLEQKKYRLREQAFVAEGPKVVGDLLKSGYRPLHLIATPAWFDTVMEVYDCDATAVTTEELQKLSFLQHPQQVLGVFALPQPQPYVAPSKGLYLALDGVQDPGNLGTIIRLADWFGISTIYCSPDTADAWNPKVVQATMGSLARVNIIYTDIPQLIGDSPLPVYGTLLDGENIYRQQLPTDAIIVMGNEGNGISPTVRAFISNKLLIPAFHDGPESLNVAIATAIVCSEFRRGLQ